MNGKETVALLNVFKAPLLKLLKDVKDEVSFFIDDGLQDYIDNIRNKFNRTKTFLYRNENVDFYSVFFPVSLSLGSSTDKINSLTELFSSSRFVTIIGNAGSGKTMLMKHFFLTSITTQYRIPLVIELRNLNDFDGNIIDYIYQVIFNNKLSPNKTILERLLSSGNFMFLLDGYDEIFSNKKNKITTDLEKFIDKYHKNNFIITSRPSSGIEAFPRFDNYYVQPLNADEIHEFIDVQLKGNEDKLLASKIKTIIERPENRDYSNFLSSPLLLSMFILTFNSYPELPKKKSKFYWNVFDTLATKHDSFTKKGGYQHERKTGLQNEEFEKILKWFSYLSLFEGKYSFDSQYLTTKLDDIKRSFNLKYNTQELIEDLTLSISIIIIDGIEYKFPHKSLQEYFCALLIKDLSVNQKEKIYSDKLSRQAKLSFGGNENFWNLCLELDKANFTKFFLIKNLDQIYQELKGKYPLELLRYFYEATNLREDFIYKGNEIYFHSFGWKPNALTQILDFLGIYVPLTLSVRDHENRNQPLLKDLLLKNFTGIVSPIENNTHYYIIYISAWTTEMSKVLTQLGVTSNAVQLVEKIRIKLIELKNEIEQEDLNTINLLELS